MKDIDLTKELITATRNATLAYHNYMYTDREYVKGQKLYLREMHFLLYIHLLGLNVKIVLQMVIVHPDCGTADEKGIHPER